MKRAGTPIMYAQLLVPTENLNDCSDGDVVHVLATRGHDQSGDLILGENAYQQHMEVSRHWESRLIAANQVAVTYPEQAELALAQKAAGSSVAGELPKFTAMRELDGEPVHAIVKFSGADTSTAVSRYSDLMVCEHLALETARTELGIPSAHSAIISHAGRTFLDVVRFDWREGLGRAPICTLSCLNGALIGNDSAPWPATADAICQRGRLSPESVMQATLSWWFVLED